MLDLVMGHTSNQHPWFIQSCKDEKNEYTDAYIWSDHMDVEHCEGRFMCGLSERPHMFKVNYYAMQPALNYGYYKTDKSWQMPMNAPAAMKNHQRLIDVCRFWLDMGAAGFRVDMAHAMIKNDPKQKGTIKFWQEIFAVIKKEFPDSVFCQSGTILQKQFSRQASILTFDVFGDMQAEAETTLITSEFLTGLI